MDFLVWQSAFGGYSWLLRGARRAPAAVSPTYRAPSTCRAAVQRLKRDVRDAPIVDSREAGADGRAPGLKFVLGKDPTGRQYVWTLVTANRQRLAGAARLYSTRQAARAAAKAVKEAVPGAPVAVAAPLLPTFDVKPVPSTWGANITLESVEGIFGAPGATKEVWVLGALPLTQSAKLSVSSGGWSPNVIQAKLPLDPSWAPPYTVEVRGLVLPAAAPLIVDPELAAEIAEALGELKRGLELARRPEPTRVRGGRASEVIVLEPATRLPLDLHGVPTQRRLPLPGGQTIPLSVGAKWTVDGTVHDDRTFRRTDDKTNAGLLEKATYTFVPEPAGVPGDVAARRRLLEVAVTLKAAALVENVTLPLSVDVLPVVVPRLAALFNHKDFSTSKEHGQFPCVLLVLPGGWEGVDGKTVASRLLTLKDILERVRIVLGAVYWLVDIGGTVSRLSQLAPGLKSLADRAAPSPTESYKFELRVGPRIPKLDIVEYWPWYTANDTTSSIYLLGAPGEAITVYNNYRYESNEGMLAVRIPEGRILVEVPLLHGERPAAEPPEGRVDDVYKRPPWGSFNDTISSVRLGLPD